MCWERTHTAKAYTKARPHLFKTIVIVEIKPLKHQRIEVLQAQLRVFSQQLVDADDVESLDVADEHVYCLCSVDTHTNIHTSSACFTAWIGAHETLNAKHYHTAPRRT